MDSRTRKGRVSAIEPYSDIEDAAEFIAKPKSWIYANQQRLDIPRYRIGNQWRYKLSELAAWVEANDG